MWEIGTNRHQSLGVCAARSQLPRRAEIPPNMVMTHVRGDHITVDGLICAGSDLLMAQKKSRNRPIPSCGDRARSAHN